MDLGNYPRIDLQVRSAWTVNAESEKRPSLQTDFTSSIDIGVKTASSTVGSLCVHSRSAGRII